MAPAELSSRTLAIVVNDPVFFLSHRLNIAMHAQALGMRVHVITPPGPATSEIEGRGLHWIPWKLDRWTSHPAVELAAIVQLRRILLRLQPDIVHAVTIKPVLYCGMVARFSLPHAAKVSAISGLGQVFTSRGIKAALRRAVVKALYRVALAGRRSAVIFQNHDDRQAFLASRLLREEQSVQVAGAGVDINHFSPAAPPAGPVRILFASRLLAEKGVREFVEAARLLRQRGISAECIVAGEPAPGNPSSISASEYASWKNEGIVRCVGYQREMLPLLHQSHIATLPSYYGEGIPKFLIEAASCGLPIVTTDWPGCRDIVQHGENGILVPPRSSIALADALAELIMDPDKRAAFGREGRRKIVEGGYSEDAVLKRTFDVYRNLLV